MESLKAAIDLNILRELRETEAAMVAYYGESAQKERQNAALIAAGLPPLHAESWLKRDRQQQSKRQEFVDVLDAVIAHFSALAKSQAA